MTAVPPECSLDQFDPSIRAAVAASFANPATEYVVFAGMFNDNGRAAPMALFVLRTLVVQAVPLESITSHTRSVAVCSALAVWLQRGNPHVNRISAEQAVLDGLIRAGEQCDAIKAHGGAGIAVSYAFRADHSVNLN